MTYYPVVIPTLNRYEHLKRCVESLSRNTHAEQTELIIGLDYPPSEKYLKGYLKIKEFVLTITGFKKVTVLERTENYGAERNIKELFEYVFNSYDAIIFTEDDNEFSPCFLDFINKALEKYKNDPRISSVHGYSNIQDYNLSNSNILFSHSGGVWGVGQWKSKLNLLDIDANYAVDILKSLPKSKAIFDYSPYNFFMLVAMLEKGELWGDVIMCCKNVLNGWFQVKPRISMVRNWGQDGSGLHCGINNSFEKQEIQTASVFDLDDDEPILINSIERKGCKNKELLFFVAKFVKFNLKRFFEKRTYISRSKNLIDVKTLI